MQHGSTGAPRCGWTVPKPMPVQKYVLDVDAVDELAGVRHKAGREVFNRGPKAIHNCGAFRGFIYLGGCNLDRELVRFDEFLPLWVILGHLLDHLPEEQRISRYALHGLHEELPKANPIAIISCSCVFDALCE